MSLPIPAYPDSRPLELSDRDLLLPLFNDLQPLISELSFANLYLFRHIHAYRLSAVKSTLFISGCSYDGQPYFLPPLCGEIGETVCTLLDTGKTLYGADDHFLDRYLRVSGYSLLPDRDNDDYLYLRSELADLDGPRFHKKKNRINYFTNRHRFTIEPFAREHHESALQLLEEWGRVHGDAASLSVGSEIGATREGILRQDELGLTGIALLTDRGVSAFALGEQLNADTFVCHFEKADPFQEGSAQLVNRELNRFLPERYRYLNREQDLGKSGLRAAKNSYHPVGMIRKYRVRLHACG